jgi:cytochrome P450
MSDLGQMTKFAANIYLQRARVAYAGYVGGDDLARLILRPGRTDPYVIYERLRERGTLTPTRLGNWVSTSYRVCDSVLRDRRFGVGYKCDRIQSHPEGINRSFLLMNPPDHTRLRRVATPVFSPKAVATYQPRIEKVAGQLLDEAASKREFDLVSEFAVPLPIAVITDLFGIPDSETAAFAQYGALISSVLDGIRSLRQAARLKAARAELIALFERLFEQRRRDPRDDLISHVVAAEGDKVKPSEMLPMCLLILFAGFDSTANLIGNGAVALLDNPDQWQALTADPANAAPKAVEEALRFDTSFQLTYKEALEPVELEGQQVREGQLVVAMLAAANRDPEVYDRPLKFDITREHPAPHLAFSAGIHHCIGHSLGRLEAAIAFRLLAERLPGLRRVGPVTRRKMALMHGPRHVPVSAA